MREKQATKDAAGGMTERPTPEQLDAWEREVSTWETVPPHVSTAAAIRVLIAEVRRAWAERDATQRAFLLAETSALELAAIGRELLARAELAEARLKEAMRLLESVVLYVEEDDDELARNLRKDIDRVAGMGTK